MKTFCQFQEDTDSLRRQLQSIEKQDAPKQRLEARRKAAKRRMLELQQKAREKRDETIQRHREMRYEELQTEQSPVMVNATHPPNPYNVAIAKQQAIRKRQEASHAQNEIQQTAVRQQEAKNRRLKAIMSRHS